MRAPLQALPAATPARRLYELDYSAPASNPCLAAQPCCLNPRASPLLRSSTSPRSPLLPLAPDAGALAHSLPAPLRAPAIRSRLLHNSTRHPARLPSSAPLQPGPSLACTVAPNSWILHRGHPARGALTPLDSPMTHAPGDDSVQHQSVTASSAKEPGPSPVEPKAPAPTTVDAPRGSSPPSTCVSPPAVAAVGFPSPTEAMPLVDEAQGSPLKSGDEAPEPDPRGRFSVASLPQRFLEFLESNGIDPAIYEASQDVPRHVRLRPALSRPAGTPAAARHPPAAAAYASAGPSIAQCTASSAEPALRAPASVEPTLVEEVEADLGVKLQPLPWLPGFFALPPSLSIAGSQSYKSGRIFGMDAASGAAVAALQLQPGDQVLDLCAAPGAKLVMMADSLGPTGSLTAVDVALPRLAATKTLLVKYKAADRCRLFLGDATRFCWPAPVAPVSPEQYFRTGKGNEDSGSSTPHGQDTACSAAEEGAEGLPGAPLAWDASHCTGGRSPSWVEQGPGTHDSTVEQLDLLRADPRATKERTVEAGSPGEAETAQEPVSLGEQQERASSEVAEGVIDEALSDDPPSGRRRKTRKERRRAKKLRQFFSPGAVAGTAGEARGDDAGVGGLVAADGQEGIPSSPSDHPELYFVGKRAWQWWDPQQDGTHSVPSGSNVVEERLYDKVLVDAECTHDGSFKHVLKFESWGWDTLDRRFMDPKRLEGLGALQRALLARGYQMLKPGGLLVYCTCSLTKAQNEDVVGSFLGSEATARVVEVEGREGWPCRDGSIPNTLRFDPLVSATGGLFIALITKDSKHE